MATAQIKSDVLNAPSQLCALNDEETSQDICLCVPRFQICIHNGGHHDASNLGKSGAVYWTLFSNHYKIVGRWHLHLSYDTPPFTGSETSSLPLCR